MRRLLFAIAVTAGVAILSVQVLDACGAKFLVSSRAARLQRMQVAANPATILLYWNLGEADQTEEGTNNYEQFRMTLEKAGHSIEATTNVSDFRSAAKSGKFDILMMQLGTARQLRDEIATLAPDAAILPVAEFLSRPEKSSAKKEFGNVLSVPTTTGRLLATIDDSHNN